MHRFSLVILFAVVFSALDAQEVRRVWEPPYDNGVAAVVEDRIVTFDQIRREMAPLVPQVRQESRTRNEFDQQMGQLYLEILQNLIDRVLIIKAFQDNEEMRIPDTFLENEMDTILIEDFNNDRARFLEHLESQGKTMREFRRDLMERIIVSVMRGQMRRSQSEISPARIQAYYNENGDQFFEEAAVHLRMIVLRPLADESTNLLLQHAASILGRLDAGDDFAELARRFSQDSKREEGGDAGWISRSDIREDLAEIAFNMEVGEYSDSIQVGDQVFILKVEDRREEGVKPIGQVRDEIESILADQIAREAQERWLDGLRKGAYVRYL